MQPLGGVVTWLGPSRSQPCCSGCSRGALAATQRGQADRVRSTVETRPAPRHSPDAGALGTARRGSHGYWHPTRSRAARLAWRRLDFSPSLDRPLAAASAARIVAAIRVRRIVWAPSWNPFECIEHGLHGRRKNRRPDHVTRNHSAGFRTVLQGSKVRRSENCAHGWAIPPRAPLHSSHAAAA